MMDMFKLVKDAYEQGVLLFSKEGKLGFKLKGAHFPDELKAKIKTHKAELIDFLDKGRVDIPGNEIVIEPALRTQKLPLSSSQQRIWFIEQFGGGSTAYNMVSAYTVSGKFELAAANLALQTIIDRHEVLRTVYHSDENGTWQVIKQEWSFEIAQSDIHDIGEAEQEAWVEQAIQDEMTYRFDLVWDVMVRCRYISTSMEQGVLLFNMHHIASDGWSIGILVKEFVNLYQAYRQGRVNPLPALEIQYADYAVWQRSPERETHLAAGLEYWRQQLSDLPPVHGVPLDYGRPTNQTSHGRSYEFSLDHEVSKGLQQLALTQGCTLFMVLHAAFTVLLGRHGGQRDIVVGTPVANRLQTSLTPLIGCFMNTLVLRSECELEQSFIDYLGSVREINLAAQRHQNVPFELLVERLQPERSTSYSPLFQIMFSMNTNDNVELQLEGVSLRPRPEQTRNAMYELTLEAQQTEEGLIFSLEYNMDLFAEETIKRLVARFTTLLMGIVASPSEKLGDLALLPPEEQDYLLHSVNQTAVEYDRSQCIHERIEAFAEQTPDAIALIFGDQQLTYAQLNARANQLAHQLRAQGVSTGGRVAVLLQRGIDMVTTLLAVMKAGAAYVPVDPSFPADRVRYMLNDAEPQCIISNRIISNRECASRLVGFAELTCLLDHIDLSQSPTTNIPKQLIGLAASAPAYVIYTSGSTGNPKGVMVSHSAVNNFLISMQDNLQCMAQDNVLAITTISFDIAVLELYLPWLSGATCVVAAQQDVTDPARLVALLEQHNISLLQATPTTWNMLLESGWQGRSSLKMISGGEALPLATATALLSKGNALWNMYGPTETTVWSTIAKLDAQLLEQQLVTIGLPLNNTTIYLLDEQLKPVPFGAVGELYIGGDGLAEGYFKREDLTAERFINLTFSDGLTARVYKTGDLARYTIEGSLVYLGRNDYQVKLRGHRIELGEIEQVINLFPQITRSVVVALNDQQTQQYLAGYLVAEQQIDIDALRQHLEQKLPTYMLPRAIIQLETLPLTLNNKIDRKALPTPQDSDIAVKASTPPINEKEEILAAIWCEMLGVEQIGRDDNFFMVGGHSLIATKVITKINEQFQCSLQVRDIFEAATVALLAERVPYEVSDKHYQTIPILERKTNLLPQSYAQQRIWFIEQFGGDSTAYNMVSAYTVSGKFELAAANLALKTIIDRHEVLRTVYHSDENGTWQVIKPEWSFEIAQSDISDIGKAGQEAWIEQAIQHEMTYRFDLAQDVMVRCHYISTSTEQGVLLFNMHHIASDGWSMGVLVKELVSLYQAYRQGRTNPLPALEIQYADYAVWQHSAEGESQLAAGLEYWRQQLSDLPPVHGLPLDYGRPANQTSHGRSYEFSLDNEVSKGLQQLALTQRCTLFMVLHAAFTVLLSRYGGQRDIVVGTPIANRLQTSLTPLIGCFVNTLVLRSECELEQSFIDYLRSVREVNLAAQRHQNVPFELLVEQLQPERSTSYSPLFQIMFSMNTNDSVELQLEGVSLWPRPEQTRNAMYELTLDASQTEEGLTFNVEYNTDLFAEETIKRLVVRFTTLLMSIVACPSEKLGDLALLPPEEQDYLLHGLNQTAVEYDRSQCIHERMEAFAEQTPDAIALVFGDQQLTYAQLNARANQLAHYLVVQGAKPDSMIAICIERSIDMIVSVLAILKSGSAYLPLDPAYPQERLAYIIDDAQPLMVITNSHNKKLLPENSPFSIDVTTTSFAGFSTDNIAAPELGLCSTHLAYVLYTSGSTGMPKGVMIEHQALVNLVVGLADAYLYSKQDRVLQFAALSFDMSIEEIFGALGNGSTLVLRGEDWLIDVATFWQRCREYQISAVNLPTTFWHEVVSEDTVLVPEHIRQISVGGEQIKPDKVVAWYQRPGHLPRLVNAYGPTEYTVNTCIAYDFQGDTLSIGRPIQNTAIFLLDKNQQLVPFGAVGEICVAGDGVARGYINKEQLTRERFIDNPFVSRYPKLYRTGDLGRYSLAGDIQYYGRDDHQVKIRGFRIELGEIETRLRSLPTIRDAVVIAREDESAHKYLAAYITLDGQQKIAEIRHLLSQQLPSYMVPSAFVVLEEIPLTANRKVDRKALPKPDFVAQGEIEYIAPATEQETLLAEIWRTLFGLAQVSAVANFFELGGHSLLSMKMLSHIKKQGYRLDIRALFEYPKLRDMAKQLYDPLQATEQQSPLLTAHEALESLVSLSETERALIVSQSPGGEQNIVGIYPLAPLQEGILFHHMMCGQSDLYVTPMLYSFPSNTEMESFIGALDKIIQRHDALRTGIFWKGIDEPVQVIYKEAPLPVVDIDLRDDVDIQQQLAQFMEPSQQWMDVTQAPLVRVTRFIDHQQKQRYVMVQEHHLISDHVSLEIIQEEFLAILTGDEKSLPAALSYREFVLNAISQTDTKAAQQFFTEQLAGVDEITAPFGITSGMVDNNVFTEIQIGLPADLSAEIRRTSSAWQISPALIFHMAWALVLAKTSGTKDVIFGTVLSGRLQSVDNIERVVGLFINTLPLRVDLSQLSVAQLMQGMQQKLVSLLQFEQVPTAIAEQCSKLAGSSRLFDSILNYRHSEVSGETSELNQLWQKTGIELVNVKERTNYPITLSIDDFGDDFSVAAQIDSRFDAERLVEYLINASRQLVAALQSQVQVAALSLDILDAEERAFLLHSLNQTVLSYDNSQTLIDRFEAQVKATPDEIALNFAGETMTYSELNQRSNQLAQYLLNNGAKVNTPVVMFIERSFEMVITVIAILKTGAGYVPLDTSLPTERLNIILSDLSDEILVTMCSLNDRFAVKRQKMVLLDDPCTAEILDKQPASNLAIEYSLDDLGYVLYTSGSTGKPKAIEMPQWALSNLLRGISQLEPALTGPNRWLQFSSIGFDLSFEDLFMPLLSGGSVQLIDKSTQLDIRLLAKQIQQAQLQILNLPYAVLQNLAEYSGVNGLQFPELRVIVSSAERLKITAAIRQFFTTHSQCKLVNHYGPAETHVVTSKTLQGEPASWPDLPTIGRSLPNVACYILDEYLQPAPMGAIGELYLAGDCLSRGYYQQPQLTAERYLDCDWVLGKRVYRTGDLASFHRNGEINYFGRNDHLVKIRGFRIELGDIEAQLSKFDGITGAVVIAIDTEAGDKQLIAYFIAANPLDLSEIKAYLSTSLPDYMLPSAYVRMAAFPLNTNGKVDRGRLPQPRADDFVKAKYIAPMTELEQSVAKIWQGLLQQDRVSMADNFFDLGGHSLLAMKLISRIEQAFSVGVPIAIVFERSRLEQLCDWLEKEIVIQRNKSVGAVVEEYEVTEW
ncbi:non-ribosomal peptide synthetase [Photorhabdus sp. CRCIA-P01]|uniref:non-ribosomal peptide synthetase n=1 Tax=Photorhabdus sp. CRCIA-P01 TaxID=2019570 RepID=UPI001E5A4AA5|nr:non-ribosomal peptide synthetase [Photorhabdus sp. CRCIA-P01]